MTVVEIMNDWTLLATEESGNINLEKAWLREAQRLYKLFCRKNKDYGEKNLAVSGILGVVVRLSDKLGRQWNIIINGKPSVQDEKLIDTFRDSANYNIAGALMLTGEWPQHSFSSLLQQDDPEVILNALRETLPGMSQDTLEKIREAIS